MNVLPWEDTGEGRKPSAEPCWEAEADGVLQKLANGVAHCNPWRSSKNTDVWSHLQRC